MSEPARNRVRWLGVAVLLALGVAGAWWAYAPHLDNFFVCDDFAYLNVGQRLLREPGLLWNQGSVYRTYLGADMRPLGNALWAGLVALFGLQPRPYYLLALGLHLLNGALLFAVMRRWLRDDAAAALAALLFWTAYGPRNGVAWLSNLNESFLLTLSLVLFGWAVRRRERGVRYPWPALGAAVAGLIKESISPLMLVLMMADAQALPPGERLSRLLRRYAPVLALFALYAAIRLSARRAGFYADAGFGPHSLAIGPALVACSFTSQVLPLWLGRVLDAPGLWPPLAWAITLVVAWLAVRAPRAEVRLLAAWVLLQAVPYTLVPATVPANPPSHYLYLATAPAMTLVALGLVSLWRLAAARRWVLVPAVLLTLALARWVPYGLARIRMDERLHWQEASDTLRRDFTLFDQADLPQGTTIYLLMLPRETPAGGAWWGWEGYPLFSRVPVTMVRLGGGVQTLDNDRRPWALFVYNEEQGPQLQQLER